MEAESAYIALGGNLGDPRQEITRGVEAITRLPRCELEICSSLYRSPPLTADGGQQPDYLNAVVRIRCSAPPAVLLGQLQGIEAAAGRSRSGPRWGPRILDLDLLLYGRVSQRESWLTLPHPEMMQRSFVLVPLLEIAPELPLPGEIRCKTALRPEMMKGCTLVAPPPWGGAHEKREAF
ncbi:MAG: 2-amino-4-hydroxy-6-hydroxymethyldihydropteridine diphosphokinase [Gammaproteobacteria bacterium]|nr:2-amino-4-hydroxy-6-hydroxymethyldihydropteridine diphosphokinase [Gammaproteobacteria bacterium]